MCSRKRNIPAGFTLLEMLVVVTILGVLAGITVTAFRGDLLPQIDEKLVRAEMQEIAKAIRHFKQDTGYYPGEGPFAASSTAVKPSWLIASSPPTEDEQKRWLKLPANFHQLLAAEGSEVVTGALARWDAESGRGWRGPYLQGYRDGYVLIGNQLYGDNDGDGDIDEDDYSPENSESGIGLMRVPALADPFTRKPIGTGVSFYDWKSRVSKTGGGTEWSESRERWGSPYLFLKEMDGDTVIHCRLVSLGPDGKFYDDNGKIEKSKIDDIELILQ